MMMNSKKPLIGHNSLLDIVHFYQQFHKDLPLSVEEFKKDLNVQFPKYYDTKILSLRTPSLDNHIPGFIEIQLIYQFKNVIYPTYTKLFPKPMNINPQNLKLLLRTNHLWILVSKLTTQDM
jgi:hypothetical protein